MSCSYDKTKVTLSSAFDSTWPFNNSSNFEFDENLIEVTNGRAQLKPLDLELSGDNFVLGNNVGSYVVGNSVRQKSSLSLEETHVNTILPAYSSNLVGYWRMEGDFLDSSGNDFHATANGDASADGEPKIGLFSAKFDGVGDYANIGHENFDYTNNFTVSVWFKTSATNIRPAISKRFGANTQYDLYISFITGRLGFYDGTTQFTSPGPRVDNNEWHQAVWVINSAASKMYVDGQPVMTFSPSLSSYLVSAEIGSFQNGAGAMNGLIDDLAFWNIPLNDSDVFQLYESQKANFIELSESWTPKWDSIIGYWKMDGNWQDSSGNGFQGEVRSGTPFFDVSKVGSSSVNLMGVGNSLKFTDTNNVLSTNLIRSWGGWFKVNSNTSTGQVPIFEKPFTSHVSPFYDISLSYNATTMEYICRATHIAGLGAVRSPSYQAIADQTWRHLICTYDDQYLKMYINGELVSEILISQAQNSSPTNELFFGIHGNPSSGGFDGNIDDWAIWNSPLSNLDIYLIYNRQKQKYASHYDSKVIDLGNATSTWPDLSWSTSLPFGKELVGDFDNDGNPDTESSSDYSGLSGDLSNGLIGYWSLNEKVLGSAPGGKDFKNLASSDYHGDLFYGTSGGHGLFGGGLTSSQKRIDPFIDFTEGKSSFTVSAWVKSTASTSFFDIFYRRIGSSGNYDGLNCYITGSNGFFSCRRHVLGSTNVIVNSNQQYNNNKWFHFAYTYDGLNSKLYIDGTIEVSKIDNNVMASLPARHLRIGEDSSLPGTVDEPAIWNRALTDLEVKQLYRRGANRVKLQVKSCVDSSCACKSFGSGGSETDCDGDSIINALDTNDMHRAEFIGPGGDGTTYYSELYNRPSSDISFQCALNTTDDNPGVCVENEITLAGSSKPTSPEFLNINYTQFVSPSPNRYAQVRVYMEADENTACSGDPCLPELSSISLNPSGVVKYANTYTEIKPKAPIIFSKIFSLKINASACASFRLARAGVEYYYSGGAWTPVAVEADRSSAKILEDHILQFATQYGPGELEIIGYLKSDVSQTAQCFIDDIDLSYK